MGIEKEVHLDSISDALEAVKRGEVLIVVDDEDRENEGDFFIPAEKATSEVINFMATHGRGLICVSLLENRCRELQIPPMTTSQNNVPTETAFCVSVDLIEGCTTGISASDRYKTIQRLIDSGADSEDFRKPGHTFPLMAREGGVLRRPGHTEASVDLARLAGMYPAGVIVEIMNEDGTMARMKNLVKIAKRFDLKIISIEDLIKYRIAHETLVQQIASFEIENAFGTFKAAIFKQKTNEQVHIALTRGVWTDRDVVAVKVDSNISDLNFYNIISSTSNQRYDSIFSALARHENNAFIMVNRKISIHEIQNFFTSDRMYEASVSKTDPLDIGTGAQIIRALNIRKVHLLHQKKMDKKLNLQGYGIEIIREEVI